MASHAPSLSSRSVSPVDDDADRPYDPFLSPLDPIETSDFLQTSMDARGRYNFQKAPSVKSLKALPSGYTAASQDDGPILSESPITGRTARLGGGGNASIYSMSSLSHHKTMDADTQALVDKRVGEIAQWNIHWITPASIVALFVAGLMTALAHHFFYVHLNGRPANNQLLMIRYGTALAFFVKSTLAGCVIMCYRQRIWHTFRTKAMTMAAIDGLFSATEDPTQFWNWEMIWNGKLATVMAASSWLIPIASIFSPAALTSESREMLGPNNCTVASFNFGHESLYDFRNISSFPGASLVFYNTTDTKGQEDDFFDYYDQPSKNARRLTVTAAYLRKPATWPQASNASCGAGYNCTYTIDLEAPGYKCEDPSPTDVPAFNLSVLAPEGENVYYSNVDVGDYLFPQIETGPDGTPVDGPPYNDSLGVFSSEPVLWIGYSLNTSTPYDPEKEKEKYETWGNVHEPKIFKCVLHYTKYKFEMKYEEALQSTRLKSREFISPLIDNDSVSPRTDKAKYKLTAAYHAMGALLRNFMRGNIFFKADSRYFVTKSDLSETRLMDPATSYPIMNLMEEVQSFYEDMLLTLLSEPYLVVADKEDVICERTRRDNVYVYHAGGLWIGYAIAVAVALASILVGAWSIFQNGVSSDIQFSRIMVTTRNPTLDRLSVGACLGGDPFPKELTKTKLRFGVLLEEIPSEVEHICFGAAGEVKEIVKHGTYAGLREWRKNTDEEMGSAEEKENLMKKRR
ncbi:hypothetical protein K504DRAFT_477276 [Pleomassaria siparia CBS 279.74]|uniref:Formylmethionine deformylase-like protein n=1 Tax=Pleomassaria siparia CBS 279.74 TaxID=1314801 RepID=A0A6G1K8I3_9PLEO|nr:hypothetical protein K504DRAFT_477276 [Pleomassaria siparia CBS 279.74]